jgi:hypothetical protein
MRPPNISNLHYRAKKHLIKGIKQPFKCIQHYFNGKIPYEI